MIECQILNPITAGGEVSTYCPNPAITTVHLMIDEQPEQIDVCHAHAPAIRRGFSS